MKPLRCGDKCSLLAGESAKIMLLLFYILKLAPFDPRVTMCVCAFTCAFISVCMYMYVCMHACMYVCMYVVLWQLVDFTNSGQEDEYMHVFVCVDIYTHTYQTFSAWFLVTAKSAFHGSTSLLDFSSGIARFGREDLQLDSYEWYVSPSAA